MHISFKSAVAAATTMLTAAATMLTVVGVTGCGKISPNLDDYLAEGYSFGYRFYHNDTQIDNPEDITSITLYTNQNFDMYLMDKDGVVLRDFAYELTPLYPDYLNVMPFGMKSGAQYLTVFPVDKGKGKVAFSFYDRTDGKKVLIARKAISFNVFNQDGAYTAPADYIADGYSCLMKKADTWVPAETEIKLEVDESTIITLADSKSDILGGDKYFAHSCPEDLECLQFCNLGIENDGIGLYLCGAKEGTETVSFIYGIWDDYQTILCRRTFKVTVEKAK